MVNKKNKFYQLLSSLLEDEDKLKEFLKHTFMESEVYDEAYSIQVSQNLVQCILDRFEQKNGDYYADLLVELQKTYGYYNGGCILFDFDTKDKRDIKKLLSKKPILEDYLLNQEEVLLMGESFSPRAIYRLNMRDENFVRRLVQTYPYLKENPGASRRKTTFDESES